jgi:hypothetical protein
VILGISNRDGVRVATAHSPVGEADALRLERGPNVIHAELSVNLLPGEFLLDPALVDPAGRAFDHLERALRFTALNIAVDGAETYPWSTVHGSIRPEATWTLEGSKLEDSAALR